MISFENFLGEEITFLEWILDWWYHKGDFVMYITFTILQIIIIRTVILKIKEHEQKTSTYIPHFKRFNKNSILAMLIIGLVLIIVIIPLLIATWDIWIITDKIDYWYEFNGGKIDYLAILLIEAIVVVLYNRVYWKKL